MYLFEKNSMSKVALNYLKDLQRQLIELKEDADVMLYSIKGKLCYINSRAHVTRFENNFTKYKTIELRLREIYFIDIDGVEALDEIIGIAEARGQKIMLTGVEPSIDKLLEESSTHYKRFKEDKLIFDKTTHALEYIGIPCKDKTQLIENV